MRDVIVGFVMLQYGETMRWGRQAPSSERSVLPAGEGDPPLEHWLGLLSRCETVEEVAAVAESARAELEAWRRRPTPPPEGETLDDLKHRILNDGEGWTPHEVALAMRVTPTLVRNVRIEGERDVEYGKPDGSLAHGLALLQSGCSLRQAATLTGIPKSTLFDAAKGRARVS